MSSCFTSAGMKLPWVPDHPADRSLKPSTATLLLTGASQGDAISSAKNSAGCSCGHCDHNSHGCQRLVGVQCAAAVSADVSLLVSGEALASGHGPAVGTRDYGLAILYPALVIGAVAVISAASGVLDLSQVDWIGAWRKVAIVSAATVLVALITEEGFFRGWLFASLRRAGVQANATLLLSSLAFSLWHLSAVTLSTGFDLPVAQIPVFMLNAAVMGLIWGLLRSISGSILVSSVSHGL